MTQEEKTGSTTNDGADYVMLCKTKAGKGLKVVHNGVWYYTSWGQFKRMMTGKAGGCPFQRLVEQEPVEVEPQIVEDVAFSEALGVFAPETMEVEDGETLQTVRVRV